MILSPKTNSMLVQNIDDLRTINGTNITDDIAKVLGYSAAGDGGGGDFYWDSTSNDADNSGTVFQVTGVATGRWKRLYSGAINVKWFGAKGDGSTDDTIALNKCFNFAYIQKLLKYTIYFPYGTYLISEGLDWGTGNSSLTMFGDGVDKTSISLTDTSDFLIKFGIDPNTYNGRISVCGIKFYGNGNALTVVDMANISDSKIKECEIHIGAGDTITRVGLKINHYENQVDNVFITTSIPFVSYGSSIGIDMTDSIQINGTSVKNCVITLLNTGIYNNTSTDTNCLNIQNNVFDNCVGTAIYQQGGCNAANIENNYFEGCGTMGIDISISTTTYTCQSAIVAIGRDASSDSQLKSLNIQNNFFANCGQDIISLSYIASGDISGNSSYLSQNYNSFVNLIGFGIRYASGRKLYISHSPSPYIDGQNGVYQFQQLVNLNTLQNRDYTSNLVIREGVTSPFSHIAKIPSNFMVWSKNTGNNGYYEVQSDSFCKYKIIANSAFSTKTLTIDLTTETNFRNKYFRISALTGGDGTNNNGIHITVNIDGNTIVDNSGTFPAIGNASRNTTFYIPRTANLLTISISRIYSAYDLYISQFEITDCYKELMNGDYQLASQYAGLMHIGGDPTTNGVTGSEGVRAIREDKNITYRYTNGMWQMETFLSGATTNRPTESLFAGMSYFDNTVGGPIWWNGSNWVDANGTIV